MATELQPPPEISPTLGDDAPTSATSPTGDTTAATVPPASETAAAPVPPKRQRRPSVRLGEIGTQTATISYDPTTARRTKHPWRFPNPPPSKPSKTRPLTNLVNGGDDFHHDPFDGEDQTQNGGDGSFGFFGRRAKAKRGPIKRPRSNWASKPDSDGPDDVGSREFGPDSDSPVHGVDAVAPDFWHRRARVSESRENDPVELESLPESNSRHRKDGGAEGVRSWLVELGLSRYAPVFEIHEVDEEVLPMLTLEDLKDMGINAVGSRRKLYTAIQKLGKGFS